MFREIIKVEMVFERIWGGREESAGEDKCFLFVRCSPIQSALCHMSGLYSLLYHFRRKKCFFSFSSKVHSSNVPVHKKQRCTHLCLTALPFANWETDQWGHQEGTGKKGLACWCTVIWIDFNLACSEYMPVGGYWDGETLWWINPLPRMNRSGTGEPR